MRCLAKPSSPTPLSRCACLGILTCFFLLSTAFPLTLSAQESSIQEQPAPESVQKIEGPIERAWRERIRRKTLFPRLRQQFDRMDPFFRDTEVLLKPRTYSFNRLNLDGSRSEAWAAGGSLAYQSGWWLDHLSIGAEYFLSQKLIADEDKDGTGLLKPGQKSYDVLGQLYAQARYQNHGMRLYRQELDLPYVNRNDSRMTPNTFEAYVARSLSNNIPHLGLLDGGLGYVRQIKLRNADEFISMSEAAGAGGPDTGLFLGGFRLHPTETFSIGAINYFVDDVINIAYGEASYLWTITDDFGLRFQTQFTDQRSIGDNRLTGDAFATWVWGNRLSASYRNTVLYTAFTTTDSDQPIRSPYGAYPGFISLMQRDFNRAGEDAWLVGLSYNFRTLGLEDLSFFFNYAEGYNAVDPSTGASLGDQREINLTVDYQISQGPLGGLWFRLRGSLLDVDGQPRQSQELRAAVYYSGRIL